MCSFSEKRFGQRLLQGLVRYNLRNITRVYPHAFRVTSDNYNPVPMWCAGSQLVALNCQTPGECDECAHCSSVADKAQQLNVGRFLTNGQCGLVLKPAYMRDERFAELYAWACGKRTSPAPQLPAEITNRPCELVVRLLGGRHLARSDRTSRGIVSPNVDIEVCGMQCDTYQVRSSVVSECSDCS